ncbi:hypothetical protein [Hyalangium rubrum]|uniref:Uncharacterized protein n=1 Tax=Hyalangium rubrum TaxID=3103134 RepID=A0ABU5H9M5_9BACT|nr:hypothetical protein [Hyalangium sp. s54d21]MDY7229544.1 hypothetical protein [Hyalangium sp. s54d21]
MRADELLCDPALAETVSAATERLPSPSSEARDALRASLERTERAPTEAEWPPILEAPRQKKDTRYADPPSSHRPVVGPALVLAKRAFRKAFQPFINEMMRKQVEFNEAILDSLALIYEQQRENARTQAAWRKELGERLSKLENAQPPPEQPRAARSKKR